MILVARVYRHIDFYRDSGDCINSRCSCKRSPSARSLYARKARSVDLYFERREEFQAIFYLYYNSVFNVYVAVVGDVYFKGNLVARDHFVKRQFAVVVVINRRAALGKGACGVLLNVFVFACAQFVFGNRAGIIIGFFRYCVVVFDGISVHSFNRRHNFDFTRLYCDVYFAFACEKSERAACDKGHAERYRKNCGKQCFLFAHCFFSFLIFLFFIC